MSYVLRTPTLPESLVASVRTTVAGLDPAVPVAGVMTLQDRIDRATAPAAFALAIVAIAAAIALILGLVGVYAVVTYADSQRTREIGVRLAVGAGPSDVRRMVWRQGAIVVLAGTTVGLAGAMGLTRVMEAMLHGVSPRDPVSFAALTVLLLAAAGLALWLPARRASRIDPVQALRAE